jgi:inositol-pentakisphosphate 2-kinase
MDKIGVLSADPKDERFRLAMTLRDVTVYVRFPESPTDDRDKIEARIGDLDIKSPDKAPYWRDTERELIEEGWYLGKEKAADQQPLTCHLSPNDRSR